MKTKILCIFDGFGLRTQDSNNANALAKMPNFRRTLKDYFWTTLDADGEAVGQEDGLVGNSEVGHANIGGLKLVPQLSYQITKSAEYQFSMNKEISPDQLFDPKQKITDSFDSKKLTQKTIHLISLFSTGCIHSDLRHWVASIESAGLAGAERIILHIISDGRDSDRQSLVATWQYFVSTHSERLKPFEEKIFLGSLGGRFYAMDRDKNWDRVKYGLYAMMNLKNFETEAESQKRFEDGLLIHGYSAGFHNDVLPTNFEIITSILKDQTETNYVKNKFDETIQPSAIRELSLKNQVISNFQIQKNDMVWLMNFRSDRMKQFTTALCDLNKEFGLNLTILSMNDYGIGGEGELYYPVFKNKPVTNTLAETIAKQGKTQLHIAETEKYAHVTFFLNGGVERKFEGEDWVVIPSNKVNSHAEVPEMKAKEITDYILEKGLGKYDYIIVNYANPDMLGHTGDILASIQSMEFLDQQFGRLLDAVENNFHSMILTADHGNIEFVGSYDKDGAHLTDTEHNSNPVPCVIIDKTQSISDLKKKLFPVINQITDQKNRVDLTNSWLLEGQIPKPQLPLFVVGMLLLVI